jgi:hypothetical protein
LDERWAYRKLSNGSFDILFEFYELSMHWSRTSLSFSSVLLIFMFSCSLSLLCLSTTTQNLDQNEVNKLLSRVKENVKRDMKKERCAKLLHNVYWNVLVAIEALMKMDALIPAKEQKNLRKNIIDWMLPGVCGFCVLQFTPFYRHTTSVFFFLFILHTCTLQ